MNLFRIKRPALFVLGNPYRLWQTLFTTACSTLALHASAGIKASGEVYGDPLPNGSFSYTITLQNSGSSSASIKTFWYAWLAGGGDFLPSNPSNVQPPPGWTYSISHDNAHDGYGIDFQTTTTPLAPGSSLQFIFTSSDSPSALKDYSPFYYSQRIPVGSSTVYSSITTGIDREFVVTSVSAPSAVPEPSQVALLVVGIAAIFAGKRRRRTSPNSET